MRHRPLGGSPTSEKTCLILHRKSANLEPIKAAIQQIHSEGIDLRIRIPWSNDDKDKVLQKALDAGAQRIIAGGGDGTINAVVNTLVGDGKTASNVSVGIMPLGTANDFARGCGLPLDDLTACLRIACLADAKPVDIGKVNNHYFINVASAGFGAEITATTPVQLKKLLGGGAYSLMGLVKAFNLTPYKGRLLIPGQDPIEGKMLAMAVGNNRFAGGGFDVAPNAKIDDGLLDLAILSYDDNANPVKLASELKDPTNSENEYMRYLQLPEFTIEADEKLHCNLDGEPVNKKRFTFSVLPKQLSIAY